MSHLSKHHNSMSHLCNHPKRMSHLCNYPKYLKCNIQVSMQNE